MFISFREAFHPTEEEKRKHDETLRRIHEQCLEEKSCTVCKHWSFDNTVPGFVGYEGECDKGLTPFFGRKDECEHWET